MNTLPEYALKFSLALATHYAFYWLLLRRDTFFRYMRYFFIASILISLLLPVVDLTSLLSASTSRTNNLITPIPAVGDLLQLKQAENEGVDVNPVLSITMLSISGLLFCRFLIQLISLVKMRKNSVFLRNENKITIYELRENTPSFSFGRMIFINYRSLSSTQLGHVLSHEKVHAQELHTADIILMELICIINWYNPFAWLLQKAVRQNLEFIADEGATKDRHSIKEYQYSMLKAAAGKTIPLTNSFSMIHLKKRIYMINTNQSSKAQLLKFLVTLPVLVLLSVLFRQTDARAQNTDAAISMKAEPGITIEPGSTDNKPLYIVDGIIQPSSFDVKFIEAKDIIRVDVLKGEAATKKYGQKGANGVIDIHTSLPLYVIDGVVQMKASSVGQFVGEDNIEKMHIIKGEQAIKKYGEKGRNGVIEIVKKRK